MGDNDNNLGEGVHAWEERLEVGDGGLSALALIK